MHKAFAALRRGQMVVVVGPDQGEEALCLAAQFVTPDAVNFMATHGRGLVELVMTRERMQRLGIPLLGDEKGKARKRFDASAYTLGRRAHVGSVAGGHLRGLPARLSQLQRRDAADCVPHGALLYP